MEACIDGHTPTEPRSGSTRGPTETIEVMTNGPRIGSEGGTEYAEI
jgi:hypothetical protein